MSAKKAKHKNRKLNKQRQGQLGKLSGGDMRQRRVQQRVMREVELDGANEAAENGGAGEDENDVVDEGASPVAGGGAVQGDDEASDASMGVSEVGEGDVSKTGVGDAPEEEDGEEERAESGGATRGAGASSEKSEVNGRGGKLHRLNVYYPWLKFVALAVLVVGLALGWIGVRAWWSGDDNITGQAASGEGHDEGEDVKELVTEEKTEEKPSEESPKEERPKVEPEEKPKEEPKEEQPKEESVVKPSATTNPPVDVPATGGKKLVALTFDDGPSTVTTGRLLDILKAKGAKATFFVVGSMVDRAPDLLRREVAEGHEVGSHSSFHQDLSKLTAADLQAETANMDRIFNEVLGRKVDIMRPPYGAVSDTMRGYLGKPMIYWSVDPLDWKYRDAATVRANVVGATFDGAVVLMHDIHGSTVDAVAGIIDDLRAQGYEFLTVSELAAARGVGLTSGVVYYNFRP